MRTAVDAARFLLRRLDDVLALPDPLPESIGRGARSVSARLESVSGMAVKELPLVEECPECDRRGLVRDDGSAFVHCRACLHWWDEDDFEERRAAEKAKAAVG